MSKPEVSKTTRPKQVRYTDGTYSREVEDVPDAAAADPCPRQIPSGGFDQWWIERVSRAWENGHRSE